MPEKKTIERAGRDKREGKSASTQAGEFVKEQMDKMHAKKQGRRKRGAKNKKQAIAIGLSEARRSGVDVKPPAGTKKAAKTRKTRQG